MAKASHYLQNNPYISKGGGDGFGQKSLIYPSIFEIHNINNPHKTMEDILKQVVDIRISNLALKDLREYLIFHESDIAYSINDFDDLRRMFVELIGRAPNTRLE